MRLPYVCSLMICLSVPGSAAGQPPGGRAANVIVAGVSERTVQASISLPGTVEPKRRSILSSEVNGLVREMPVEIGDSVKAGRLICKLKDDTLKLDLAGATATLARLQDRLAELEAGTRPEEITLAKAAVEEAKAIFDRWQNEKERIDSLRAGGTASIKEYRDITSEYLAAAKRLVQTEARHTLAVEGPRKETIAQAGHAVEAQKAVVDRIADQLAKTTILAPFSAYVVNKRTEVGEWMNEGGPICEVVDLDEARVRVLVPESAISFAKRGEVVPVRIDALGRTFDGTIRYIVPQADQTALTFPVEVVVPNPKHTLMSGMFARVKVPAGPKVLRRIVPADAVVYEGRDERVFVIREGPGSIMAVPLSVRTGLPVADLPGWVALEAADVKVGDRVVTRGNERLTGPTPVNIAGTDPGPGQTQPSGVPAAASQPKQPKS